VRFRPALIVFLGTLALALPAWADTARVVRVFDGDTVLLEDGRKVRYLGMNAPEFQEPLYRKAKQRNEELVLRKLVRLEYDQQREDGYGRVLAWVHAGDDLVNLLLVKEGLAHVFIIPPNGSRGRELLQAQDAARRGRLGIWRQIRGDLKVTAVRMDERDAGKAGPGEEFVRLANVGAQAVRLGGYRMYNEAGRRYVFPGGSLEPGHTVLVITGPGQDGSDARGQLRLYWNSQGPVWDQREDTAYIEDPEGNLVDVFHYKGRRVSRTPRTRVGP
jgi:endonuclease YncB( thermonuclease family)